MCHVNGKTHKNFGKKIVINVFFGFFFLETLTCSSSDIDCGHSVCISDRLQCDGVSDCVNGNDEQNCGNG